MFGRDFWRLYTHHSTIEHVENALEASLQWFSKEAINGLLPGKVVTSEVFVCLSEKFKMLCRKHLRHRDFTWLHIETSKQVFRFPWYNVLWTSDILHMELVVHCRQTCYGWTSKQFFCQCFAAHSFLIRNQKRSLKNVLVSMFLGSMSKDERSLVFSIFIVFGIVVVKFNIRYSYV